MGGAFSAFLRPTPFICLVLKLLQIQPEKSIVLEYIKNWDFKYVRVLGAFYLRLTGTPLEIYQYLEPLYNDFRKIRIRLPSGDYGLTTIDQVIDDMLHEERMFNILMPRLLKRQVLEKTYGLDPYVSEVQRLDQADLLRIEGSYDNGNEPKSNSADDAVEKKKKERSQRDSKSLDSKKKSIKSIKNAPTDKYAEENALRASMGLKPLRD